MAERKIDPKFNIQKEYRRMNIVNPYRYDSGDISTDYETETIMFMYATNTPDNASSSIYSGLSNNDCWNLLDSVIKYYKSEGVWEDIAHWHPMFGGTAAKHVYNAKDINTFQMTWFGGWVHNETGNKANGNNTYASFGFIPSVQMSFNDSGLSIVSLSDSDYYEDLELGSSSGSDYRTYIQTRANGYTNVRIGSTASGRALNSDGIGIYSGTRSNNVIKTYKNKIETSSGTGGGLGLSEVESYYGAYNNEGILSFFSRKKLGSMMHHKSTDLVVIQEGLRMWEEGLGRITI